MMRRMVRRHRRRDERGSILFEAMMIVPLFLVLGLGLFELGMTLRNDVTIANAARTAARVGSHAGKTSTADYELLRAFGAAASNLPGATVNYVTVYRVVGTDSTPPVACTTPSLHGVPNKCNTYDNADLATVMAAPMAATAGLGLGCGSGGRDAKWCPANRVTEQGSPTGPDYLGVSVSITIPTYTSMFGATRTYTDSFVMRLEPGAVGAP